MVWGVCGVGEGGLSFALEHSKVCTLCDFGHLQFSIWFNLSADFFISEKKA
jgi:hypothetical protein